MQQSVDAFFKLDERTIVGKIADFSGDLFADWILPFDFVPRIILSLLHTQRHLLASFVDPENRNRNLVTDVDQLTWVINTLDP